jgi:23S rRNA pseudoU1915 N3-methylase RlmH
MIKIKIFNVVSKSAQTAEEEINKFMSEIQKRSKINSVQVNSWVAPNRHGIIESRGYDVAVVYEE